MSQPYESGEIVEGKDDHHDHGGDDPTFRGMKETRKPSSSSFNKKRRHDHRHHDRHHRNEDEDPDIDDHRQLHHQHHHQRQHDSKRRKQQNDEKRQDSHHHPHHSPRHLHSNNKTRQQQQQQQQQTLCKTFDEMNLKKDLLKGIYAYGFERPSAIQQRAIRPIVRGHDVIAQSQSGTGKTAVFAIASLQLLEETSRDVQVLILSPTRELAEQSQRVMQSLGDFMNVSADLCVCLCVFVSMCNCLVYRMSLMASFVFLVFGSQRQQRINLLRFVVMLVLEGNRWAMI
jgi:CRISPR/Cas system-associated endonuclease/helicase Cas3